MRPEPKQEQSEASSQALLNSTPGSLQTVTMLFPGPCYGHQYLSSHENSPV